MREAVRREIEVTIGPDGRVTFRPKGASGPGCVELTEELEAALGEVESRELTAEYYQHGVEDDAVVRQRTGGR
ncbi:MAG TPA: DUF2997 domain-containing protein [Thermodesulfobacteriota bacterium]|nr:DUF2997 domain-containing protein [Thermodesulfobacteriota bacterium]